MPKIITEDIIEQAAIKALQERYNYTVLNWFDYLYQCNYNDFHWIEKQQYSGELLKLMEKLRAEESRHIKEELSDGKVIRNQMSEQKAKLSIS